MGNEQYNNSELIFEANRWRMEAEEKGRQLHSVWFLMIIGSLVVTGINQYNTDTKFDESAKIGVCEKGTSKEELVERKTLEEQLSEDDKRRLFAQATATVTARHRSGRG